MTRQHETPRTHLEKTRVLIVDDHEVLRVGLRQFIDAQSDLTVTGVASDGLTAIRMARTLLPDLILMDLDLPVLNGVLATREILRHDPDAVVLAFTGYADEAMIEAALRAGACGCASKWDGTEELLERVRGTMRAR